MDRIERIKLLRLFPLIDRYHLIKDGKNGIWVFREYLDSGHAFYPKYTLMSKQSWGSHYYAAHLFATFACSCEEDSPISVFIEDIITTRQGVGIGSWMMTQFIEFLQTVNRFVKIGKVYGEIVENNGKEENELRDKFFRKFGFSFKITPSGKKLITANLEELRPALIHTVERLDIVKALGDWSKEKGM